MAVILAITAWKFRDVLESLLSRLGKIKWGESQMEFEPDRILRETREQFDNATDSGSSLDESTLNLTRSSPSYAMMQSWTIVRRCVAELAHSVEIDAAGLNTVDVAWVLVERNVISVDSCDLIQRMWNLRKGLLLDSNRVPDERTALEYAQLAIDIATELKKEARGTNNP